MIYVYKIIMVVVHPFSLAKSPIGHSLLSSHPCPPLWATHRNWLPLWTAQGGSLLTTIEQKTRNHLVSWGSNLSTKEHQRTMILKYIKIGFVSCYIHWKKQNPFDKKYNSCLPASESQSYSSNISKIFMGWWSTKKGERMTFQRNHLHPGPKGNGGPWHGWPRCGWSWHSPSPPHGPRGSTDTFLRSNSCWGYDPLRHSGGRAPNLVYSISPKDKICFMKNLYCYSVYILLL